MTANSTQHTAHMKIARRWAARVVVCLVLGAVVNVGVAAVCVLWVDTTPPITVQSIAATLVDGDLPLEWHPNTGERRQAGFGLVISDIDWYDDEPVVAPRPPTLPSFSMLGKHWPAHKGLVTRAGWPLAAFAAGAAVKGPSGGPADCPLPPGGLRPASGVVRTQDLPLAQRLHFKSGRVVPIRPLWWGLFVNSVLYGGISLAAWSGAMYWRGVRRARQGLCQECGYLVGALRVCPECGTFVSAKLVRPSGAQESGGAAGAHELEGAA